jgi:hypothetical protein
MRETSSVGERPRGMGYDRFDCTSEIVFSDNSVSNAVVKTKTSTAVAPSVPAPACESDIALTMPMTIAAKKADLVAAIDAKAAPKPESNKSERTSHSTPSEQTVAKLDETAVSVSTVVPAALEVPSIDIQSATPAAFGETDDPFKSIVSPPVESTVVSRDTKTTAGESGASVEPSKDGILSDRLLTYPPSAKYSRRQLFPLKTPKWTPLYRQHHMVKTPK